MSHTRFPVRSTASNTAILMAARCRYNSKTYQKCYWLYNEVGLYGMIDFLQLQIEDDPYECLVQFARDKGLPAID